MKTVEELFILHRAKSAPLDRYEPGVVPYLANSFSNNAVAAYVIPRPGDRVFQERAIVMSAFGEATVQTPPFIAYGAAGTSLTVLEPRHAMTVGQLAYVAAWMNIGVRWRFNWYHRSTLERLKRIPVPDDIPEDADFQVKALLPPVTTQLRQKQGRSFSPFAVEDLFHVRRAKSGLFSDYEPGPVAYIRNGLANDGIVGYVKPLPTDKVFQCKAVVVSAFCEATVQTPPFIACSRAGNGLTILEPKSTMSPAILYCVAAYINKCVRWRFNWYRQVTADRFRRLPILLPDEPAAKDIATSLPYWHYIAR